MRRRLLHAFALPIEVLIALPSGLPIELPIELSIELPSGLPIELSFELPSELLIQLLIEFGCLEDAFWTSFSCFLDTFWEPFGCLCMPLGCFPSPGHPRDPFWRLSRISSKKGPEGDFFLGPHFAES